MKNIIFIIFIFCFLTVNSQLSNLEIFENCFRENINYKFKIFENINYIKPNQICGLDLKRYIYESKWRNDPSYFDESCSSFPEIMKCFYNKTNKNGAMMDNTINFIIKFYNETCKNLEEYKNYSQCIRKIPRIENFSSLEECLKKNILATIQYSCSFLEDWKNINNCYADFLGEKAANCGDKKKHYDNIYNIDYKFYILNCPEEFSTVSPSNLTNLNYSSTTTNSSKTLSNPKLFFLFFILFLICFI